jgi:hypothetical protein
MIVNLALRAVGTPRARHALVVDEALLARLGSSNPQLLVGVASDAGVDLVWSTTAPLGTTQEGRGRHDGIVLLDVERHQPSNRLERIELVQEQPVVFERAPESIIAIPIQ